MLKNMPLSLFGNKRQATLRRKSIGFAIFMLAFLQASETRAAQFGQSHIPTIATSGVENNPTFSVPGDASNYHKVPPSIKYSKKRPVTPKMTPVRVHMKGRHMTSEQRNAREQSSLVVIDHVNFKGLSVYSEETAQAIFQPLLGKPSSIKDFVKASEKLIHKYWDDGYVLAEAEIKFKEFHTCNHEATIHIYEGQVKRTFLTEEDAGIRALLLNYMNLVEGTTPFRTTAFEQYNGLTNYIPGLTLKGRTHPIDNDPGAGALEITATQKKYVPYVSFDNRGSKFVGPYRGIVGAYGISLFKTGDVSNATFVFTPFTKELQFGRLSYVLPLNYSGDSLLTRADYGKAQPGWIDKSANIVEHDFTFEMLYQHLTFVVPGHQLALKAGFDVISSDAITPNSRIYADQIRELILGVGDSFIDPMGGRNMAELRIYQGFLAFGAANRVPSLRSEPDGKANNTRLLGEWIHSHPLLNRFSVVVRAKGQFSFQPALAPVAFYFGSYPYGSAYDPGELSGDHGLEGRLEGQYAFRTSGRVFHKAQTYLFYDGGKVWNRHISSGYLGKSGTSIGAGLRFMFVKNYEADFEVAKPLTLKLRSTLANGTSKPVRFFFRLTARF